MKVALWLASWLHIDPVPVPLLSYPTRMFDLLLLVLMRSCIYPALFTMKNRLAVSWKHITTMYCMFCPIWWISISGLSHDRRIYPVKFFWWPRVYESCDYNHFSHVQTMILSIKDNNEAHSAFSSLYRQWVEVYEMSNDWTVHARLSWSVSTPSCKISYETDLNWLKQSDISNLVWSAYGLFIS